ncbi:MAG: glutathione S-transferase family protein [Rhodospirillaceae bacterium]
MSTAVTLVGFPTSPFVRKVRVAFTLKGIAYDNDPLMPWLERDRIAELNPAGTVPVLLPGGDHAPLPESAAILDWAEQQVPDPALLPTDPALRDQALKIQAWADAELGLVLGGQMIGQRIVVAYYFKKGQGKEDRVAHAMTNLAPPLLDQVAEIIGTKPFALGETFTLADLALSTWFRGAGIAGFNVDPERWPSLGPWLERCFAIPAYAEVIAAEETLEVVQWARDRYGPQ